MAQHRPIGTGDVAALHRVVPHYAQRGLVLRLCELLDRRLVPPVERLLDQLAATVRPSGKRYPLLVQVVVAGSVSAVDAKLGHQPPQFPARKAGTNDGAMHTVMHIPDRCPPFGGRRREFADGRPRSVHLHRDHAVRERDRRLAGREDVQQHLGGTRRHDLWIIRCVIVVEIYRLSHTSEILKRGIGDSFREFA